IAPPVLRGLRALIVSLKQQREIDHRIGVGRCGSKRRTQVLWHRWLRDQSRSCTDVVAYARIVVRSEEHTSELQSLTNLVCRLLLEKKKQKTTHRTMCKVNKIAREHASHS